MSRTEITILEELCNNIHRYLPLEITFFRVEDYCLSFGGNDWSFYSDSDWRIVKDGCLLCSYDNFDTDKVRNVLMSNSVIQISALTKDFFDPVLTLSNSAKLELFSITSDEPWKIELPDIVYVPYGSFKE